MTSANSSLPTALQAEIKAHANKRVYYNMRPTVYFNSTDNVTLMCDELYYWLPLQQSYPCNIRVYGPIGEYVNSTGPSEGSFHTRYWRDIRKEGSQVPSNDHP